MSPMLWVFRKQQLLEMLSSLSLLLMLTLRFVGNVFMSSWSGVYSIYNVHLDFCTSWEFMFKQTLMFIMMFWQLCVLSNCQNRLMMWIIYFSGTCDIFNCWPEYSTCLLWHWFSHWSHHSQTKHCIRHFDWVSGMPFFIQNR